MISESFSNVVQLTRSASFSFSFGFSFRKGCDLSSMGGIGLFKQGWKWMQFQKPGVVSGRDVVACAGEKLAFLIDRHWPTVYSWFSIAGRFLLISLLWWRDCTVGGFKSLFTLGYAALFVILWSCFLYTTSMTLLVYVLLSLSLGSAATAIQYLALTAGVYIFGIFCILMMCIYGHFWITAMLLIAGGYMVSHEHARLLTLMATAYAIFCVATRVGLHGVFLSLILSFVSNNMLNKLFQRYDGNDESVHGAHRKEPKHVMEDFPAGNENFTATKEAEDVPCSQPSCATPKASGFPNSHNDGSSSQVFIRQSTSLVEMKRIMSSSNHYDVLGCHRDEYVDPNVLKKEYHKKILLVHPDKNMGSSLACESFKKLQCAYEVLSDLPNKVKYDEQLRKEESGNVYQRNPFTSQQEGNEYRSEESRCIECTKCGNCHIWICTNRSKARARWCQDCYQYHPAKDGDGWVESGCSPITTQKMEIPRAFVCAESKIFDVSEWAICQEMICRPNTHGPSFHVNMVSLDTTGLGSSSSRYSWGLDAEMIEEDEFELWLQQALASGIFSETPSRRKSWPFNFNYKRMKSWRKSP